MNVLIRADAGVRIGSGHVMRCLALAEHLRDNSSDVTFACRPHDGNLMGLIEECGFRVISLERRTPPSGNPSSWAGATQLEDASEVLDAIQLSLRPDWVIVDHYALEARWETAMRAARSRILAIDDMECRYHDADFLLNQNFGAKPTPGCRHTLLGPRFALLRKEFRQAREIVKERDGNVARILISYGGTDEPGLTYVALTAIKSISHSRFHVDVVVGHANPRLAELAAFKSEKHQIDLHVQTNDMPRLMLQADLALGAGGTTTWERCCLGLPTIVISTATNQRDTAERLARAGFIMYLGPHANLRPDALQRAILKALRSPARLAKVSRRCLGLVDGRGAERVSCAISKESHKHAAH